MKEILGQISRNDFVSQNAISGIDLRFHRPRDGSETVPDSRLVSLLEGGEHDA
jgi:hypothetical protein